MGSTEIQNRDVSPPRDDSSIDEKVVDHNKVTEVNSSSSSNKDIDREAQDEEPPAKMTFNRAMCLTAMSFLWCGSQIPLFLFGSCIQKVYEDIGGSDFYTWAVIGNMLSLAAVVPFVGAISDLLGRRYVAMIGSSLIIIGMIIGGTAANMEAFVVGMVFAGAGAGICELTALAGAGELVPRKQRGFYVALVALSILPFCPSTFWSQQISVISWRYNGLFCGLWQVVGLVLVIFFYHPPPRINSSGLTRREILARIDYGGGFLSISSLTLILCALQFGGNQFAWVSAPVLVTLLLGVALLGAFAAYEAWWVKYPMFPGRLKGDGRNLILILIATFISGGNFFAILLFWPTMSYDIWSDDPLQVGLRGLPSGFGVIVGSVVSNVAISVSKGNIRLILLVACAFMTAGSGALAAATPDNMGVIYVPLCICAFGVGAVILPVQTIATIICPDDLIATATALVLCVRVIGGTIAYSIYYNVFDAAFTNTAHTFLGPALYKEFGIKNTTIIYEVIDLIVLGEYDVISEIPGIIHNETQAAAMMAIGKQAYAMSFPMVWYVAIAFGVASLLCVVFLKDIGKKMDNHIAVRMK